MKTIKQGVLICIALLVMLIGVGSTCLAEEPTHFANVVVFVQFADSDGTFMSTIADSDKVKKCYTDTNYQKSLVSYIKSISGGKEQIDTYLPQLDSNSIIVPIRLDENRDNYTNNEYKFIHETIEKINANFSQFNGNDIDRNGDGRIDNVTFFADVTNISDRGGVFFPHKADYAGTDQIAGKIVGAYNIMNRDTIEDSWAIGTITHEFLHSMGLPDLYKETGDAKPVGSWDIMANQSIFLQYPLAYFRSQYYTSAVTDKSIYTNWLSNDQAGEITTTTQSVSLSKVGSSTGKQLYILKQPSINDHEFFAVEYRKQGQQYSDELDVKIPGSGLIIYRINPSVANLDNRNSEKDGVYVFRQGESSLTAATSTNLSKSFFAQDVNGGSYGSLDMNATIADNAIVYSDGCNSGIQISNISQAGGDTISFDVDFADVSETSWENAGGEKLNSNFGTVSTASDSNGNIYAAAADPNGNLCVYSFGKNGDSKPTVIGTTITDYYDGAKIQIYNDKVYMIYEDSKNLHLKFVRLDGNAWTILSDDLMKKYNPNLESDTYPTSFDISASNDGVYVGWIEDKNAGNMTMNDTLVIQKYSVDLNTFVNAYTDTNETNRKEFLGQLKLHGNGDNQYLAYTMGSVGHLKKITDITTTEIALPTSDKEGKTFNFNGSQLIPYLSQNNKLYVLLDMSSNSSGATGDYVFQYNESTHSFNQIGNALTSMASVNADIAVEGDTPFVQIMHQESASKKNTVVMKFDGSEWIQEGYPVDSTQVASSSMIISNHRVFVGLVTSTEPYYMVIKTRKLAYEPDPEKDVPTEIKVTPPTKTNYQIGDELDTTGMVVEGVYDGMKTVEIPASGYTLSGFDSSHAGKNTVTVTHTITGLTTSFDVEIINNLGYLLGDVNADSKINSGDALLDLQHSVSIINLNGNQFLAGDVTVDHKVDARDALKILQYSVQIIHNFNE